jgi:hypothetical protein
MRGLKILRGLLEKGVITPEQMKFPGHPVRTGQARRRFPAM